MLALLLWPSSAIVSLAPQGALTSSDETSSHWTHGLTCSKLWPLAETAVAVCWPYDCRHSPSDWFSIIILHLVSPPSAQWASWAPGPRPATSRCLVLWSFGIWNGLAASPILCCCFAGLTGSAWTSLDTATERRAHWKPQAFAFSLDFCEISLETYPSKTFWNGPLTFKQCQKVNRRYPLHSKAFVIMLNLI